MLRQMQLTKLILKTSWNQRTVKPQMIVCEIQQTNAVQILLGSVNKYVTS